VNQEMYVDILRQLWDAVRRKLPEKWRTRVGLHFTMLQHTGRFWSRIS